ncbi:MAG: hypothetical protein P8Y97_16890 [Candidatus Lokiarchaeota archaeon]
MIKKENKLICWRNMVESDFLEPCDESIELECPYCDEQLKIV